MSLILKIFIILNFLGCGNTNTNNNNNAENNISNYSNNFIRNNEKQIITDKRLNKVWQDNKEVIGMDKNYNQDVNYCKSLIIGNYHDWHLPKFDDMVSMINLKSKNIDGAFKNINSNIIKYWVSDIVDYNNPYYIPKVAWFVAGDFHIFQGIKETPLSVRCIRDNEKRKYE